MGQPTLALPNDLAAQRIRAQQAQQEAVTLVNAMTCSVYERLVVEEAQKADDDPGYRVRFRKCAHLAKVAAAVFHQEFFREVPNSAT